jgi:hypothetical protein
VCLVASREWMRLAGLDDSQGEGGIIVEKQVEGLGETREGCRSW